MPPPTCFEKGIHNWRLAGLYVDLIGTELGLGAQDGLFSCRKYGAAFLVSFKIASLATNRAKRTQSRIHVWNKAAVHLNQQGPPLATMKLLGFALLVAGRFKLQTRFGVPYEVVEMYPTRIDHEFRLLRLDNGLEVLLGRDPSYEKAVVAMDVAVGLCHDPLDQRGIAHLYEHMLFTTAFRAVSNHRTANPQHIERNLGFVYGETTYDHTLYAFTVVSDALEQALEMFAEVLTKPDFDTERLKINIGVVDQEFRDKQQDDAYRLDMVARVTGDKYHPYSGYFGGNNQTLLSNGYAALNDELMYHRYTGYSPNRMRLVVMGSGKPQDAMPPFSPLQPADREDCSGLQQTAVAK